MTRSIYPCFFSSFEDAETGLKESWWLVPEALPHVTVRQQIGYLVPQGQKPGTCPLHWPRGEAAATGLQTPGSLFWPMGRLLLSMTRTETATSISWAPEDFSWRYTEVVQLRLIQTPHTHLSQLPGGMHRMEQALDISCGCQCGQELTEVSASVKRSNDWQHLSAHCHVSFLLPPSVTNHSYSKSC